MQKACLCGCPDAAVGENQNEQKLACTVAPTQLTYFSRAAHHSLVRANMSTVIDLHKMDIRQVGLPSKHLEHVADTNRIFVVCSSFLLKWGMFSTQSAFWDNLHASSETAQQHLIGDLGQNTCKLRDRTTISFRRSQRDTVPEV